MFTPVDKGKQSFVEKTRTERQQRERERLEKLDQVKRTQAANVIQHWWRRRPQPDTLWAWFDAEYGDFTTTRLHLEAFYRLLGQYCLFSRRSPPGSHRLMTLCKRMTMKCSLHSSSSLQVPFYTLLMDKRYRQTTMNYIETVMNQCLGRICTHHDTDAPDKPFYLTGPELTTLLYYLNPATYKPVQHLLDPQYSLDNGDLSAVALGILEGTLTIFFDATGSLLREACVQRVERIVKLENRARQRGKPMDKDNAKLVNGIKLWLTTVTRIVLFPLENATDSDQLARAATRTWTFLLATPLLTRHVSTLVLDHLRKWTLGAIHPLVMKSSGKDATTGDTLVGGNGYLFLMANLVDLYQEKFMNHQEEREMALHLMTSVMHLISLATPYYSDRQRPPFSQYHPIFKWSCCPWGDQIDAPVYEAVIQDQLATLWSRHFMDQLLEPILKFAHSSPLKLVDKVTTTRRLLSGKKKNTMEGGSSDSLPISTKKDMAEFSMNTQLIFSMYSQLGNLFTVQRKIILARIAFTPGLMSQLWRVMNHFGPQGNMVIYLDAARKHAADIGNKEPLIDVLKMFCEACSLVFL